MKAKILDIAEVAEKTGLPPSTLRYYEKRGLIRPAGKNGLRRQYDPEVLERLAFITMAQNAQFSLKDVSSMMPTVKSIALDRAAFSAKARHVDQQIAELQALSKVLHHIAHCPHDDHFECPKFRKLLDNTRRGTGAKAQA
ncbi:helix-turn-helix domain-containing protein [Shimia marina]|uniref:Mercuric resistance operon regulatory protein n=1 Tax=Shimia marina TaxID=321267 RepID=A0A0P1FB15_9RHOB|nr:helix-turn-helix domain-containing protein [Shimia marina]CUH53547.1 Mercuric resistance operon regulatory protein [Shimia marina]SFD74578.1 transcriptional regulator, MerR family [Shimia marina]